MPKLLHIIASPREDESRTLRISQAFLDNFIPSHADWIIDELDLSKEQLPSMTLKRADGKYALLEGKNLYGTLKEAWLEILQHIDRFLSSDLFLISTPMWNFSIPYMLKHYIDLIVQPRYTFRYTESGGTEGLAKNKKMIVITSRGGQYNSPSSKSFDYQEPYLRAIFGFVGIADITFIIAEPMDMGKEKEQQKVKEAIESAKKLALQMKGT